jgi:hypothetical protein
VFPATAEVVLVTGQVAGLHQATDPELLFVKRLKFIIQVRRAVFPAGDPEQKYGSAKDESLTGVAA